MAPRKEPTDSGDAANLPKQLPWFAKEDGKADRFLAAIKAGVPVRDALAFAGVRENTYYKWHALAATKSGAHGNSLTKREKAAVAFHEKVAQAEAAAKVQIISHWKDEATRDWRAGAEWLARRFPDEWGQKSQVQHSGSVGISLAELHQLADGD